MAGGSRLRAKWRRWTRVFRRSSPKPELNRVEQHDRIRSLEASEQWWTSEHPGRVIDWFANMEATDEGADVEPDLGHASANGVAPEREDLEKAAEESAENERKEKERKEKERQEKALKAAEVEAAPRRNTMTARGLYEKY